MRIGGLSERTETPRRLLRYYEEQGLTGRRSSTGRLSGDRLGDDDDVAQVAGAVPVLASHQHQPTGDALIEQLRCLLGQRLLAVRLHPHHGVGDAALAGADLHRIPGPQPIEVVEGAT